jgi:hypothetical protein
MAISGNRGNTEATQKRGGVFFMLFFITTEAQAQAQLTSI